ncbi:MAG: lysylphosphatidylglycerol synthase transmembrane domain-containing protein [Saprospiraceae bacterium]
MWVLLSRIHNPLWIRVKNLLKFFIFLGTGVGILYLVYLNQSEAYLEECLQKNIPAEDCSLLEKVLADFASANYWWILMVWLAFNLSNWSRAMRWKLLLKPLGYTPRIFNLFMSIIIGYFANLGLPRMGEVLRAATIQQYEKIPLENAMGTIVTDRIMDVICILLITGLAVLLEFDTFLNFTNDYVDLSGKLNASFLLLALGIIGIIGFIILRQFLVSEKWKNHPLVIKVKSFVVGFKSGILSVSKLENPGWFLFHTFNIWLMYFTMTYFCFFAFAPTAQLAPVVGLVVFVFGSWGIVIPSPGGMGTYHFLAQTALMMYGVSGEDGFSWANIAFFSIQIGANVFLGLLSLLILPFYNRQYSKSII